MTLEADGIRNGTAVVKTVILSRGLKAVDGSDLFQNRCLRQAGGVSDVQFRIVRTSHCRGRVYGTDFGSTEGILKTGDRPGGGSGSSLVVVSIPRRNRDEMKTACGQIPGSGRGCPIRNRKKQ